MNYTETLDYLYNTLPMFSRMGSAAFKKDLTNIRLLCDYLKGPQKEFKTIHVGGTNGKGSVSHMLAAILQTAGYKTGLYTSPHLKDFRERIRINGQMISEAFVVDFVERIKHFSEEIQPSFFEITVAMAFDYFAAQNVDIAIIEVGLGGRLDSTNIIDPELSVITNIGWDHMSMLGNTLTEIAAEKGGIIKADTPVVLGEKKEETENIFREIAAEKGAPLYFAEDYFSVKHFSLQTDKIRIQIQKGKETFETFELDLPGIYQTKNLLTVLQATEILNEKRFKIETEIVKKALANTIPLTGLQGRWQVVHKNPTVVLEVAHNKDGMQQMLSHLQQLHYHRLHLVIGMVKDKEVEPVLKLLPVEATYYFTNANIPRALPANDLKGKADVLGLSGDVYDNVNEALAAAIKKAANNDLIIVCGSIFLVAEVDTNHLISDVPKFI